MSVDLSDSTASGRSIRLGDALVAFDPSAATAEDAKRTDTLSEVITRIFTNVPAAWEAFYRWLESRTLRVARTTTISLASGAQTEVWEVGTVPAALRKRSQDTGIPIRLNLVDNARNTGTPANVTIEIHAADALADVGSTTLLGSHVATVLDPSTHWLSVDLPTANTSTNLFVRYDKDASQTAADMSGATLYVDVPTAPAGSGGSGYSTEAELRTALGLSSTELQNLVTGMSISSDGNSLNFTHNAGNSQTFSPAVGTVDAATVMSLLGLTGAEVDGLVTNPTVNSSGILTLPANGGGSLTYGPSDVRAALDLTSTEADKLGVGHAVSGNTFTVTQNDGTTVSFTPSGGGSGTDTHTRILQPVFHNAATEPDPPAANSGTGGITGLTVAPQHWSLTKSAPNSTNHTTWVSIASYETSSTNTIRYSGVFPVDRWIQAARGQMGISSAQVNNIIVDTVVADDGNSVTWTHNDDSTTTFSPSGGGGGTGGNNPRGYFWFKGQSARDHDSYASGLTAKLGGASKRMEFRGNDPDERYDDSSNVFAGMVKGASAVSSNIDPVVGETSEKVVFVPPSGRYDIVASIECNASQDSGYSSLYKVSPGTDPDFVVGGSWGYTAINVEQSTRGVQHIVTDVTTDGTEQFYLIVKGLQGPESATRFRGWMMIEKRA